MRWIKALIGALAVSTALPMAAASADVWDRHDAKDDTSRVGDISRIRLDNAPRNLFLRSEFHAGWSEGDVYFYLDTVRDDPGPEFRVRVHLDARNYYDERLRRSDVTIDRVDAFGPRGRLSARDCVDRSARLGPAGAVDVTVPRGCLTVDGERPGAVRMSVSVFRVYGGEDFNGDWDHAPQPHRLGVWVAR